MPRRYTPRTVNRGDGKGVSKGVWVLGKRKRGNDQKTIQKLQKTLGRLKNRVHKQDEQAALAEVQKLEAVEAERLREPCHTDKDSPNNAAHVALGITSQPLHKLNHSIVQVIRQASLDAKGDAKPYARGSYPERTAVQDRVRHLGLGCAEFFQPEVNAKRCSIPLWSVLEELLELTGFDAAHGVDPDSEGRYDMRGVKAFGFAASTDGAWLTKGGKGFLVQAFKPTDYHITRALSGRAVAGPGDVESEGAQSSLACIASGWYGAADTTSNNFELSGAVFKELARLQHEPYIHSRTGKGFNIASALPQDMKSMQTYSGLGGCSATKPYFSTYDACDCDHKGMEAYFTCASCLVARVQGHPSAEFPCCHMDFIGAADHAAALPLQMAWEASLDVIKRIVEVRSALQGTGNRLKNLVTHANTLRRIAAAE
ncbi:hypothetical protein B484DRAFT_401933, partial [Ochromonadaceae sp. CCMP2298]